MRLLDKIEEEKRNANLFASRTNGEKMPVICIFSKHFRK